MAKDYQDRIEQLIYSANEQINNLVESNFDYEMNSQILKDVEEEEAVWLIGFDKETKEYMEI